MAQETSRLHEYDIFILGLADELGEDTEVRQRPLSVCNAHDAFHPVEDEVN